jgi:hypothetical protein
MAQHIPREQYVRVAIPNEMVYGPFAHLGLPKRKINVIDTDSEGN